MCSELAVFSFYYSKSTEGTGVLMLHTAMSSGIGLTHSDVPHLLTDESHIQGNMADGVQMHCRSDSEHAENKCLFSR